MVIQTGHLYDGTKIRCLLTKKKWKIIHRPNMIFFADKLEGAFDCFKRGKTCKNKTSFRELGNGKI